MEHEFERIIRDKVNLAEKTLVPWEKEWVRSKIGLTPVRKSFVFYYAAASLLLATTIFFYGIEMTHRKELDLQLKSIDLAIEKSRTYQLTLANKESTLAVADCPPSSEQGRLAETKPQVLRKIPRVNSLIVPMPVSPPENETMNFDQSPSAAVTGTEKESIIPLIIEPTHTESMNTVKAIIGSDGQNISLTHSKEKKLKFRIFRPNDEPEPPGITTEPLNFLSKIN